MRVLSSARRWMMHLELERTCSLSTTDTIIYTDISGLFSFLLFKATFTFYAFNMWERGRRAPGWTWTQKDVITWEPSQSRREAGCGPTLCFWCNVMQEPLNFNCSIQLWDTLIISRRHKLPSFIKSELFCSSHYRGSLHNIHIFIKKVRVCKNNVPILYIM